MRVAQICTNVMSGSVGTIVRNIYDGLTTNGDDCLILFGRGKLPTGYNSYKFDKEFDIYFHLTMARLFDSDGLYSRHATKRLIHKLKEFNPDVVHIHCLHGYYLNYPMLFNFFKEENLKVVWTMHDCWAYTGHCCYYDYPLCNKWKDKSCKKCQNKKSYPKTMFFSKSNRNFYKKKNSFLGLSNLKIVTPSQWLKDELSNSFFKDECCKVINNGININIFNSDVTVKKEKFILGVASIWDERKGLKDFIELKKLLPDDITIQIVGASTTQVRLLKEHKIKAIGRTSSVDELVDYYRKALFFFNPTYEDNYPTVNIESIACGTPVITYDTGGSGELIKKYNFGRIIENKDYKSILNIINDTEKNKRIEEVEVMYLSSNYMVEQYIDLYTNW